MPPRIPDVPFTWTMAKADGMTRHRLDELMARREVRRVLRNVYVRADVEDSTELRAAAARLVVSPFAVICDRTAAWLWGVDTFDLRELDILPPLESCVPRHHNRTRRPEIDGGVRDLAPRDMVEMGGVWVTTPLRTSLDLACKLARRRAMAALDGFMRRHDLAHNQMTTELVRYYRRRGVTQARRLVPLADARAESPGESWSRLEIIDSGLPAPELQIWVEHRGRPLYRLDMGYRRCKVAVEYDGREFHEREADRLRDRRRREWLAQQGWTVIVVTKDDFTPEAIDRWTRELRTALGLLG